MAKFTIKNARLSFPSLFNRAKFDGVETKFEGTLLLDKDKDAEQIAQINKRIENFLKEKFPAGAPKSVKITVFTDGSTKDYDGYENAMAFKGTSNKRITVVDRDRTPLIEEDGKPQAGDYVNAIVDLWYSDHPKGGKQVLGNLMGVQFVKEGERFGAEGAGADDFDDLGEDESFDI